MPPLNVLVVEDSESDAAFLARQLAKAGYEVADWRVESEAEMREALDTRTWDVVIADYQLPGFDARAALALLQTSGKDIPFLVVSGAIGEETAVELMRSGACDYLMKDRLARLGPAVERALWDAEARRERERAYAALLESERHLRISESTAHVGHWIHRSDTGEMFWSEELYRILGLDPQAPPGDLTQAWGNALHPDDRSRLTAMIIEALESGETRETEYRILRPDGSVRYVSALIGSVEREADGKVIGHSGVVKDITPQKEAELALVEKVNEEKKRAHELEMITSVSSSMRRAQTWAELVDVVLQTTLSLLDARFACMAFQDGQFLSFEHAVGTAAPWQNRRVPAQAGIFGKVMRSRQPVMVSGQANGLRDALPDWIRANISPSGTLLIHPLFSGSCAVGVILLDLGRPGQATPEQSGLLVAVAEMAGNSTSRMRAHEELERMVERREKELSTVYEVISTASRTLDIRGALQQALALTLHAVGGELGDIYLLREPGGMPEKVACQIASGGEVEPVDPAFGDKLVEAAAQTMLPVREFEPCACCGEEGPLPRQRACAALPMRIQDRVVGVLGICKPRGERFTDEEMTLLAFIADHMALLIENTNLLKRAEHAAVLEERSRLARELHDSVTQLLYSANLYAVGAERYAGLDNYENVKDCLGQIRRLTQQALKEMRLLVYELRSSELEQNGLSGALESRLDAVERRSSVKVNFTAEGISLLPRDVEENLYRIAVEALNNSLKHSRAGRVQISLSTRGEAIALIVEDDGCGFDPQEGQRSGGMGLSTMRERAKNIGGWVEIWSEPGKGARISVIAPAAGVENDGGKQE